MALACASSVSADTNGYDSKDVASKAGNTSTQASVYAVYGGNQAEDFLPYEMKPVNTSGKEKRKPYSRPRFEFPEVFYVVGIPILLILFISLLVSLLKEMPDTTDTE
jgi:hypothetical protein